MLMDGQRMTKNKRISFVQWFESGKERVLSLLFPSRCPICDEILTPEEREKGIHLVCESKLYPVKGIVCMHCGRPLGQEKSPVRKIQQNMENEGFIHLERASVWEYCRECYRKGYVSETSAPIVSQRSFFDQGKSLYLYKGDIKKTMYRFKYANKREYATFFAQQALACYEDWIREAEVIVPVPMYRKKQKRRGYNQAETLAKELSKRTGIPVDNSCVYRVKNTLPQKGLSDSDRKNNLENAFQKGKSIVQYSHILVVDDIYTTGYTAQAVARELRKQGGRRITFFSVCIGGRD